MLNSAASLLEYNTTNSDRITLQRMRVEHRLIATQNRTHTGVDH